MVKTQIIDRYNDATYLTANPTWHAEDSAWKARQIDRILQKNNVVVSRVCEVGCGAGEILVELDKLHGQLGYRGYELSVDAFQIAKQKEKSNIKFILGSPMGSKERYI